MIDAEGLSVFVAIAETRSFSRAADRLGLVQSVVSKRLKRLEDQLGTILVDRAIRTRSTLTRVGELYLPEARATLLQLEKAEWTGRNLGRGNAGPLRIGYVFSAAMNGTLGKILSSLNQAMPDLKLQPRLLETPEQLMALDAGKLDLALVRPRPTYPAGCYAFDIHEEPLVACMAVQHPLAAQANITPFMLAHERFIVPQFHEHVGLIDNLHRLAAAGGFAVSDIERTADFVTAACLAASGYGIVLAPTSLTNLTVDGLAFRQIAQFDERVTTALVYRFDAPEQAMDTVTSVFSDTFRVRDTKSRQVMARTRQNDWPK